MPVKLPYMSSSGGSSNGSLNVFTGTTAPTTKNGIWINSSQGITNIVQDNDIWTPNTFYDTGLFTQTGTGKKLFYYNGYLYYINRTGLFKGALGSVTFTNVSTAFNNTLPDYGLTQDPNNPRYLYGLVGSSSNTTSSIYKYDLETYSVTAASSNLNVYMYAQARQQAIIYNNYFYAFRHNSASQGSSPIALFKYDLNKVTYEITTVLDTSSLIYPHMQLIGTNLYILYIVNNVITAKKINLTNNSVTNMSLSGDTSLVNYSFLDVAITNDGANKIYFMSPTTDNSYTKIMKVLNVDTGVITSYTYPQTAIGASSSTALFYYGGIVYIYNMLVNSYGNNYLFHFKLTGKSYPTGTVVITRTDAYNGVYQTELLTPKERPSGSYNLFKTGYNMAYQSIGGQLVSSHSVYNGNGTSWVQIR